MPRRRRVFRVIGLVAASGVLLGALALASAVLFLQGERLAGVIRQLVPALRGGFEVTAVRWRARALIDVLTDRPTPLVVEGLQVVDPEGTLVLDVPRLEVKVRLRSAIRGQIHLDGLTVTGPALWRFGSLKREDANGFLSSFELRPAPRPLPPPQELQPLPGEPFVFEITNARLHGLTAVLDFPSWGLELRDIEAPASFIVDGDFVGFDVTGLEARAGGSLRIVTEVLPFDHVRIARVATTREWPDKIFLEVAAARTGQSTLRGKGFFTEIYGYGYTREPEPGIDIRAAFDDAADALAAVAAAHAIPGLLIGGENASVSLDLREPFATLAVGAQVAGLDVSLGQLRALNLGLKARMVTDPLSLSLDELEFSAPGGGRLALGATLQGTQAKARVRLERFSTESYLPPDLKRLAGGKIHGQLVVSADLGERKRVTLDPVTLLLSRSRAGGLPRTLRVDGRASATPERVSTERLVIAVPGASAEIKGEVQLARRLLALGLRASTSDLPRLLTSLGIEPLARGAALSLEVGGSFDRPHAHGEAVVHGIAVDPLPELPELRSRFRLQDGTVHIDSFGGPVAGGAIEGQGSLQLFRGTVERMLRSPVVSFRLEGRQIELHSLLAIGAVSGRLSFAATVDGPADRLRAHLTIPAGVSIEVLGTHWEIRGVDVEIDQRELVVRLARLERQTGARIQVEGRMRFGGPMSWQVAIEDVALEGLPGLAQSGVPVTGRLSAHLDVSGSVARPRVAGQIGLRDVVARGARLGDATLTFAPAGEAGLAIAGSLFGRFELAAQASFGAGGPRLTATLEFRDLILEEVLPELAALGDGRGRATGRVTVAWHPAAPIEIDARLSSLAISFGRQVSGPSAPGRQRIQIRSADELRFRVVGGRMSLSPTHLVTDGGDLRAQGELVGETVQAELSGHLDLELLQPFLRDRLDSLGGDVTLAVKVSGRLPLPVISGEVAVSSPVRLRAAGFDHELTIPSGVVRVRPGTIELGNLAVAVGGAVLRLHGKANVDQRFAPTALELDVSGEISGELMETVAPSVVSDATGRARVSARVRGTPAAPDISARIDLGQMSLRLRDLGRQITVESGTVELTNRELVLRNVRTRIDDQGRLLIGAAGVRPGRVAIKRLTPTLELGEIDLPLKGDRLTYRADEVEIDDLGFTMALTGRPETGLRLRGEVLIMSGRYVGDFTVRDLVVSRRVSETSVRPFYEGKPLLADLALDLRVRTVGDSFMVQNNLAPEIHIVVDLRITGTPVDPRIAGSLRPTDGRFHIIGLRGDFELVPNVNHITFVDTKSIAAGETPELNLEAQNLVTDSLGNEHNVRMRIRGPIGQAAIDLSSDSGLDRSQTLLLLVSGRGGEELTRFGINQNPTVGSNIGRGTEMVGQLTRDTVSNLVEPYIDDTLQLLTGGTINLRPTVGADGFELRVSARVSRQLDLQLSFLRGFQDQQRYRAETNVWLMDYVRLRGFGEHLTLTPQQGLSEQVSSLNMELTLDFPLRLRRP